MVRSACQVEVGHITTVHAFLDSEVEHGLFIAILNASDACLVALLIIELHTLYN